MKRLLNAIGIAALTCGALPAAADGLTFGGAQAGGQAANGFTSDTGGYPTFSQVNGTKAKVQVKHASCGEDCWTHVLAKPNGNLDLTAKMGFACPAGDSVQQIYYSVGNSGIAHAYEYKGGLKKQSVIATATLQPWTPEMFQGAAVSALGPSWSGAKDNHHNTSNSATIMMHQDVEVLANCMKDQTTRHKTFKVHTKASIIDLE
jgi:hypothetical protein